ncbi:NAD(P)H-dependent oxidoreductase [Aureibacter tunicatorum]|uniref:Nitroreductase n=1 Tax=Aureibacter tunicatorum TaxID=866807 RepID=A0AAE3XP88_9BACT|nr:NAD(P)H-dependent oxidoreductase [Aureibacter tunicatorum]MDR6239416.1 nitroreductase [Aureibacter tunicatorum]BDD04661.1 NAD(P)H-dependent oxidoreductase [Aureibacter tunicatorum]
MEITLNNKIIESLKWRYAVKKFSDKKLTEEKLEVLIESLRLTPSAYGLQGWKFLIIENKEIREQLVEPAFNQRQVLEASHLIVMCTVDNYGHEHVESFMSEVADARNVSIDSLEGYSNMIKGTINNHSDESKETWLSKQLYIALGNLLTTCAIEEVDSCPMEGFIKEKYDDILNLKEKGLKSQLIVPIGYRAEDDPYASLKKVRKNQEDVIEWI